MNFLFGLFILTTSLTTYAEHNKVVIAHRGASGYLPENSIASTVMAHNMNVDYIEQDLVMTKDDELIIFHDIYLNRVTNVAEVFPKRKRINGKYYVIDFTLDEIKSLKLTERYHMQRGKKVKTYPNRFSISESIFKIPTLEEVIEIVQELNTTTGNDIGIYPEIKNPSFHKRQGKDISKATLKLLKKYGYSSKNSNIFLQCFDEKELIHIRETLMPELQMDLSLVRLLRTRDLNLTKKKLKKISQYADAVGPPISKVVSNNSKKDHIIIKTFVEDAHSVGLLVHPYTFRRDVLPSYAANSNEFLDIFFNQANIDGIFTDFPDDSVKYLNK